jgi:hypothetical protein
MTVVDIPINSIFIQYLKLNLNLHCKINELQVKKIEKVFKII